MNALKKHLSKYKLTLRCCTTVLILQVVFTLALPVFMGNFINTGIQKKGIMEDVPHVMTKEAMGLFEKILPSDIFNEFNNCYSFYENTPENPERYFSSLKRTYFLNPQHEERAREIYENALISALIFTRESFEEIETIDFNTLYNYVSLRFIYEKLEGKTLSTEDINYFYTKSTDTAPTIKKQIAAMILPYIYEDAGVDVEQTQTDYITHISIIMLICVCGQLCCMVFVHVKASDVSSDFENNLRKQLLQHTTKFGKKEFAIHSPEKINTIINTDVNRSGMMVNYILKMFMYAPLLSIGGTVLSIVKNPIIGILILLTAVIIVLAMAAVFKLTEKKYELMNHIYGKLAKLFKVNIEQILTIRAAGTEKQEVKRIKTLSCDYQKHEYFVMRSVFIATSIINLLTNITVAIMVIFGGNNLLNSMLTLGDMVTFLQYALLTISAFMMVGALFLFAPRAILSIKNIDLILSQKIHRTTDNTIKSIENNADIRFEKVRLYEIPDTEFNFTVTKGSVVGITGSTGCGKTTLMELLMLRHSPASGNVFIGNSPLCKIDAELMRKKISYAQSTGVLFTKTLRDNLLIYGCENDDCKMMEALKNAQCDFLPEQPLDKIIMNAGANFSGGQKSRISIAGAIGKKAEIYIFDDCFTSLDSVTEEKILNNIINTNKNATIIIISQRINTLMRCDKTIVLSANGVEAEGTHDQLLKTSEYYNKIFKNQICEVSKNG